MTESALAASYWGTETVLVVEDEPSVRRGIGRMLEWAGYQVIPAANADEAVHLAANPDLQVHLLLTDYSLPGVTGIQLAEVLRSSRPGLKVLFMSGYSEGELPQGKITTDVAFLQKPFPSEALLLQVRAVLHPKRRRSDKAG